jgi:DNA-binding HxlR family transcriptional regulator
VQRRAEVRKHTSASRSDCPVACSLDLVGDRWTLLIVRDLLMGKRRFSEFLASGEGITTSILTERLQRLGQAGLVERWRYLQRPPRYEYRLTDRGAELSSVVKAIAVWGQANLPGR